MSRTLLPKISIADALGLIALATAFGGAVSVLTNIFVFRIFGLNFPAIASPSDILIGGIAALQHFIMLIMLVFTALITALVCRHFGVRLQRTCFTLLLLSSAILMTVFVYLFFYLNIFEQGVKIQKVYLFTAYASLSLIIFCTMMIRGLSLPFLLQVHPLVTFFACLMITSVYVAQDGQGSLRTKVPNSPCKLDDHVAWLGSTTAIVTCSPPPFNRHMIYRIVKRDDLVLTTDRSTDK